MARRYRATRAQRSTERAERNLGSADMTNRPDATAVDAAARKARQNAVLLLDVRGSRHAK